MTICFECGTNHSPDDIDHCDRCDEPMCEECKAMQQGICSECVLELATGEEPLGHTAYPVDRL
jgi:hypothetical protein